MATRPFSFAVDSMIHAGGSYTPYLRQALMEHEDFQHIGAVRTRRRSLSTSRQLSRVGILVSSERNASVGTIANRICGGDNLTRKDKLAQLLRRFRGDFVPATFIFRCDEGWDEPPAEENQTIFCKNASKM